MKDLWPESFESERFACNAVELLTEQAAILKDKTGGIVQAALLPIQPADRTVVTLMAELVTATDREGRDELSGKTDINTVFELKKYKFELYSDTYHFRVFTLYNRAQFPIDIVLDEGIAEELGQKETRIAIDNNEELMSLVANIFSCRKVSQIISHMILNDKRSEE